MALAVELEVKRKSRPVIGERRRVLIAAAVAAVVGPHFRILEIYPVSKAATNWKHCGPLSRPAPYAVLRKQIVIRTKTARKEKNNATANHT